MLNFSEGNQFVFCCIFTDLSNRAIQYESYVTNNNLLIEICSFNNVSSADRKLGGGAIFFRGKGHACINQICANNCKYKFIWCSGYFSAVVVYNINIKNCLNFSSIACCGIEDRGVGACCFGYARAEITQANFSRCHGQTAGIYCFLVKSNISVYYSTLENLTSSASYLDNNLSETKIFKCRYIGNEGYALIYLKLTDLTIGECEFIQNKVEYCFKARDSNVTVYHCYFDESCSTTGDKQFSFNIVDMETNKFDLPLKILFDSCEGNNLFTVFELQNNYSSILSTVPSLFILSLESNK